jgi:hypothetical protein
VDLDSVAPVRESRQGLIKVLGKRPHAYSVVAFGFSPEDDKHMHIRAAGLRIFEHRLVLESFAVIAEQTSHALSGALSVPSS